MYKIVWVSEERSNMGSISSAGSSFEVDPEVAEAGTEQVPQYVSRRVSPWKKYSHNQYMPVTNQPSFSEEEEREHVVSCV